MSEDKLEKGGAQGGPGGPLGSGAQPAPEPEKAPGAVKAAGGVLAPDAGSGKAAEAGPDKAPDAGGAGAPDTGPGGGSRVVIQTIGLHKSYNTGAGAFEVLHGVDFTLREGEFVSIMGPSGSGKSTFMNILGCLDTPTSGVYELLGEDVAGLSPDQLAARRSLYLGFVFQGFNLLPKADLLENTALPLLYARVPSAERKKRAMDMLEKVGLAAWSHHRPAQVSGGQQQRAAIARALVGRPSLVLADEPTGNLDSQTSDDIMRLFTSLNNEGLTLAVVTHEPDVAACAKRLVRFLDGRLVEDGPVEDRRAL